MRDEAQPRRCVFGLSLTAASYRLCHRHRWRNNYSTWVVECVRGIGSLSALGRQHAPSQQILIPRMQRWQSEFAFAGAYVCVAVLAVREVPVGLCGAQHG